MKRDITTREDIMQLVDRFYDQVKTDPEIGPVFAHVDWPNHLPVMYNFWSSMLLGDRSYTGNPFQKHLPLGLRTTHFDRWLSLFEKTVEDNFEGEKADEVKMRARSIAGVFQVRMGLKKPIL